MAAKLLNAFGYQGDAMKLPVADVDEALPFYEKIMRFSVESRADVPHKTVTLARDQVRMALNENGGDPTQDGVAFHVDDVEALFAELRSNGLTKEISEFQIEKRKDGSRWKVFFVVAPDGLCFWLGQDVTEE